MTTEKKQNFYTKHIKPHLDIMMFFTIVGMGVTVYLTYEKDKIQAVAEKEAIEQKIPKSTEEMIKIRDHVNEVPSDVENFKRELNLIKTGDTLKAAQKEIQENIKVIDSFYKFSKKQAIRDSIEDIAKQKSRDQRTKDVNDIKRENQNIANTLQAIQRKLDTIN